MRESIIQTSKLCRCPGCYRPGTEPHEVFFGTANRKKSIEDKMVIYLCPKHHRLGGKECIHENREFDLREKRKAQIIWELEYGKDDPRSEFIKRYGRSYL